ncbi:indole-3-glycerol phosphate synthase TrpC [Salinisphaera hydrothermalis]|uniref:Indole-3-glycerol phosphate synthase n=1 Tax=Salinisphaera hydrothermalis (strain C41B8) TaxID=1304275 RepID=A0A084IIH6_SALHC|nr:indole-3-glycerol phosphate synthase TrpC [Salinisphaera hydrothermalis]KEZ76510.1 indole-3-glycerol-phosphate synthase [Salinisphaera hydrothermalis C41B8]
MSIQTTHTILDRILARKREEIAAFRASTDDQALADAVATADAPRGFATALEAKRPQSVIAEIKKASPSKGLIREDFDVAWLAERYAAGGAACLSVLTDRDYFQGDDAFLGRARGACGLPVLRKDFMIDPIQIDQSRALGADCILLIAAALSTDLMHELAGRAFELGMDVLAEVHNAEELSRALTLPEGTILGINNRDLHTFDTTLDVSLQLRKQITGNRLLVSESGIFTRDDRVHLAEAGFGAFLVGESFMRQPDPGEALSRLIA